MLLKRVAIRNVKSFLDRAELMLDGPISIVIGPNGGGKTNLLDIVMTVLRRYLLSSTCAVSAPSAEQPNRYEFRENDALRNMTLDRHSRGAGAEQFVEIEVEVTSQDMCAMTAMQKDAAHLMGLAEKKYTNHNLHLAQRWVLGDISVGSRFLYRLSGDTLVHENGPAASYRQFLQLFEANARLRDEYGLAPLSTPMIYLPVNRSASGFSPAVQLANYNESDVKRNSDAASSRSGTPIVSLAIGRLAQRFRLLLEQDRGAAKAEFRKDGNLLELTKWLAELGYEWELDTIDPLKNEYGVRLKKQGTSFWVGGASSGERELLTYLFAIFSLNVRDALIVIDEPELHLHPKWQKTLLKLFVDLARSTGNQFLMATHSPTFVSPDSIQYVSRVFSQEQVSRIQRIDISKLPEGRHLLAIVNSMNNERLFFADGVVLVEGVSDRIFFEAVLNRFSRSQSSASVLEIVGVGGKGYFDAYSKLLTACGISYVIVADLDYIEQVGSPEVKALFKIDARQMKVDVIDNVKSLDGDALVAAIDQAIKSRTWEGAEQIWEYIKGRRRQLRTDLDDSQKKTLESFLSGKRDQRIYILSRGALEAYLPTGHGSKDLDKLLTLLAVEDFWGQLPIDGKQELECIALSILGVFNPSCDRRPQAVPMQAQG